MGRNTQGKRAFDIRDLEVTIVPIAKVRSNAKAPRRKTDRHVSEIGDSVEEFGMVDPLLVDENCEIIAGESTFLSCIRRGMDEVPVIFLRHLNEAQKVALRLAHNRLCEKGEWDQELLAENFEFLMDSDYEIDLETTGFEVGEIDIALAGGEESVREAAEAAATLAEDVELDESPTNPVSRIGDVFTIGEHIVVCGDATGEEAYRKALGDRKADLGLTDPPYNVDVGRISGRGKTKHDNFVQGSGEMSPAQFREFVGSGAARMRKFTHEGAYSMFFTAWYSMRDISAACEEVFGELSHMCIWAKTNGGMGSPWRNAWEGILVFRNPGGKVRNNIQLGRFGRNRTDVFRHAGVNVFRKGRMEELQAHPTCKPVGLLKDLILDVTPVGGTVLDPFLGSGSLIIAAHEARRRGVGIELDPRYVDVAIRRIERSLGIEAVHESGRTFSQLGDERREEAA